MKKIEFTFYHIDEAEKPDIADDIMIVGKDEWDVITYNGDFLPAFTDYWCMIDLSNLK